MPALYLPWDPTRPYARDPANAGCPAGYFTQYVAPGEPQAAPLPDNPGVGIRCRLIPASLTGAGPGAESPGEIAPDVQAVIDESGTTWGETAEYLAAAIGDTAGQVTTALARPFGFSWTTLLLGVGAVWLLGQGMGRH